MRPLERSACEAASADPCLAFPSAATQLEPAIRSPLYMKKASTKSGNVRIPGHKASIRLEPIEWEALHQVARIEDCTIHDVIGKIDKDRSDSTLTSAMRLFLMSYYQTLARPAMKHPGKAINNANKEV